jgi:hypothetical protein
MGGIGMLSAGMIGGPGLGYLKDRYSGEALAKADPAVFADYKAAEPSKFLNIESTAASGLDGKKFGEVNDNLAKIRAEITQAGGDPASAIEKLSPTERKVVEASIAGDRQTLKTDALIPATMAVIYLVLLVYFKVIGGYKPVHLAEELTGGIKGPMQA